MSIKTDDQMKDMSSSIRNLSAARACIREAMLYVGRADEDANTEEVKELLDQAETTTNLIQAGLEKQVDDYVQCKDEPEDEEDDYVVFTTFVGKMIEEVGAKGGETFVTALPRDVDEYFIERVKRWLSGKGMVVESVTVLPEPLKEVSERGGFITFTMGSKN